MKGIGIIGCGHWGKNYLRVFRELSDSYSLVIYDSDQQKLASLAGKYPRLRPVEDPRQIFDDKTIDSVVIATPAETHYELLKRAIKSGKHILAEKPLTLSSIEAEEVADQAQDAKVVLMVSHTFLYNPAVRQIKEYLKRGEAGKIYYLKAVRTHLGLIRDDVNVFWDLAAHDISIFGYLLGSMPVEVSATGSQFIKTGREDVGFATLIYPDNIAAHIHVSWIDSNKERQISIVASKERIVFDDLNNLEKIRIFEKGLEVERSISNFGEFQLLLRDGNIISPKVDAYEPLRKQCEHFIECVEHNKQPLTDGRNGVEVVKVLEAIQQSLNKSGAPVKIS